MNIVIDTMNLIDIYRSLPDHLILPYCVEARPSAGNYLLVKLSTREASSLPDWLVPSVAEKRSGHVGGWLSLRTGYHAASS